MALRLYNKDGTKLFMESEFPCISHTSDGVICENIISIEPPFGRGYYKEIYFEGIHIGFGAASLNENTVFYFESDDETVEMHFSLKGKNTAFSDKFSSSIGFEANQHNLIYANQINGKMQWESTEFHLCEINFNPNVFKRFLPDEKLFNDFKNSMENGKSGSFSPNNFCMKPQMYQIIKEIIGCERKGIYKKMFLESKIIELLLVQLEQITTQENQIHSLKKKDIDKIYAVREIIINNLNKNISLIELAHRVGTNEFMLKKGFKELFGTTVFNFWNDTKMEQAKSMIIHQDVNIKEISDLIGYKNQRHFTTAFKRKFGIPPSQLKNKF
ncbi:AraC family transcriptional regulator [Apibacter raozihei]|uniref:helix-turn-helix domain-containing protein n=1 Tax=Apibacter raozihei TaxID=2500547 RepID=UPI000FE39A3A|nr:AraC family transcriptional regulator [Apibacter raozihei]